MDRPLPNSYWVIPGRLLAGEHPVDPREPHGRARLELLHEAGIDYFIDLTEEDEHPGYRHLLPGRTQYRRSAIVDAAVPNNVGQVQELLSDLREALAAGRSVYVHCRAGIGRTGLVIGCYLAEESGDGKAAIRRLNQLWQQSERAGSWPKVPQTAEQADYIRHWPKFGKRRLNGKA